MKPSSLLCAKSSVEGVVMIEGQSSWHRIRIVGSSVAKFIANEEYSNSATFSIKKGDRGFIAVNVLTHQNGKFAEVSVFFLKIGWSEDCERPLIDLDSQWGSKSPERLGVITYYGIKTEIGGLIFSSHKNDKKPGMRYVGDHNLLCRYLAGDIEADALEKAATEYIEEVRARERLPELEKKIQELTALVNEKEKLLAKWEELPSVKEQRELKSYEQEMLIYAATRVIREVEKQWFHHPSLKKELQKYKAELTRK